MKESSSTKNLLIALAVLVAIGGAGYMYATRDRSADDLLVGVPLEGASVEGSLLTALNQLQTIRFDTEIFDHPVFESLTDISTRIAEQPKGRPNPFAPLEGSAPAGSAAAAQ